MECAFAVGRENMDRCEGCFEVVVNAVRERISEVVRK